MRGRIEKIRQAAETQLGAGDDRPAILAELKAIAERRVRLGAVIAELARRHQIRPAGGDPSLERAVIDWLLSRSRVTERPATSEELLELSNELY